MSDTYTIELPSDPPVRSMRLLGFGDALRIARGCLDYGGGHRSDEGHLEIYHHGIQTVINALEAAEKNGLADTQCAALWRMGQEKPNDQAHRSAGRTG